MENERPTCPCHGWDACVHKIGGRLAFRDDPAGGIDWERNWQWHCMAQPCDDYSLVMIILDEWIGRGP